MVVLPSIIQVQRNKSASLIVCLANLGTTFRVMCRNCEGIGNQRVTSLVTAAFGASETLLATAPAHFATPWRAARFCWSASTCSNTPHTAVSSKYTVPVVLAYMYINWPKYGTVVSTLPM